MTTASLRPLHRHAWMTAEFVRARLDYDPQTGIFVRAFRPDARACDNSRRAGKRAGKCDTGGYRQIYIHGALITAHRLAWLLMTGSWPAVQIDHANGDRDDNRWANLRAATPSENSQNVCKTRNMKTSKYVGVSWSCRRKKWTARIMRDGVSYFLGAYLTEDDAHEAYVKAKRRIHEFQPIPRDMIEVANG